MKYSEDQINAIKKYYPNSEYDKLLPFFPVLNKKNIKAIAQRYGVKSNNPGHRIDLTGRVFTRLTVIGIDYITDDSKVYWKCKCTCGNEITTIGTLLRNGSTKSCGCLGRENTIRRCSKDYTGRRFGMLVAVERFPNYQERHKTFYLCKCDCGGSKMVESSRLVMGKVTTCGCLKKNSFEYKRAFDIPIVDNDSYKYLVYKHIAPNGKVYIGVTRQTAEDRWRNGEGYNTQKKFYRAIQKYGWENFKHEVIAEDLSKTEAYEKEVFYIKEYNSVNRKYGYNVSEGGTLGSEIVTPVLQYYNDDVVNFFDSHKQAAELLGVSDSTIRNYIDREELIAGYRFEELKPMYSYDISEAERIRTEEHLDFARRVREQHSAKTVYRNKSNVKGVCQYDLEGHFIKAYSSIADAQRTVQGLGSINAALKGRGHSKSAGGYLWKYDTGDYGDIPPLTFNTRPVMQIDPVTYKIVEEFNSSADAYRTTGIRSSCIIRCCRHDRNTSGGYIWRYKDDPDAFASITKKANK